MKAVVAAFNQEKALVGAFSVIVQPVVEPMDRFAAVVITLPSPCFRCFSKNLYTLSSLLWGLIFRRILIVIFPLHYLQLRLLSLSGPLDQEDALMLILDQIPETHIRVSQNTHLFLITKYMYLLIPVQLYRKSTYYIP